MFDDTELGVGRLLVLPFTETSVIVTDAAALDT
jgi:hypothetical protein